MFAKILIFAFVTSYVTAEIPSYIHICGRRDPNIDQCVLDNVINIKNKICEGIPELDVPSNDPMILPKLVITETDNIKLYVTDSQVYGLCDFTVNYLNLDLDKLYFNTTVLFNNIYLNSTYDFHIHVLVPIASKGQVALTAEKVNADVHAQMKLVSKGDKRYVYLSKMILNLKLNGFTSNFHSDNNSEQLREIINNFIGNNQKEIVASVKPALEEAATKMILSVSNSIVKHFTYEELFPDRT